METSSSNGADGGTEERERSFIAEERRVRMLRELKKVT
jgi:hypothetical protein